MWQGRIRSSAAKLYRRFTDLLMLEKISRTLLKPNIPSEVLLKGIQLYQEKKKYLKCYQDAFFSTQEGDLEFWRL